MAGVSRQSFATEIKIIRLMCTGRVDLAFIFRAFLNGADGVFIGGCWPGECHYVTEGNYDALANTHISRKLLTHIGLNPERLRLEWIAAAEGNRYAQIMDDFAEQVRGLGPLGKGEGMDEDGLKLKLEAVNSLIPYIKLVEREKLRVPKKSEEAYDNFFGSDEVNNLFNDLIADKLAIGQILLLLRERPLSTGEISEILNLNPSQVSRHINDSSRRGLVRYDVNRNCYALSLR
ncbi:MAG: hydrogenase iron-sulfur subunit [Proteobacteria bacterium]|nr:hydrogenase iron-sulfur subunit [Pseudomonadota bacterium]